MLFNSDTTCKLLCKGLRFVVTGEENELASKYPVRESMSLLPPCRFWSAGRRGSLTEEILTAIFQQLPSRGEKSQPQFFPSLWRGYLGISRRSRLPYGVASCPVLPGLIGGKVRPATCSYCARTVLFVKESKQAIRRGSTKLFSPRTKTGHSAKKNRLLRML